MDFGSCVRNQSNRRDSPKTNDITPRAGYTLSGTLFGKNVGVLHLEKTGDLFLVITVRLSAVTSPEKLATFFAHYSSCSLGGAHYFGRAKNSPLLLWGPFLWGPLFGLTC